MGSLNFLPFLPALGAFKGLPPMLGESPLKPLKAPIVVVGTPREVSQGLHATMGEYCKLTSRGNFPWNAH